MGEHTIPCPGCGAPCDRSAVGDHALDCSLFGEDAPYALEPDDLDDASAARTPPPVTTPEDGQPVTTPEQGQPISTR